MYIYIYMYLLYAYLHMHDRMKKWWSVYMFVNMRYAEVMEMMLIFPSQIAGLKMPPPKKLQNITWEISWWLFVHISVAYIGWIIFVWWSLPILFSYQLRHHALETGIILHGNPSSWWDFIKAKWSAQKGGPRCNGVLLTSHGIRYLSRSMFDWKFHSFSL